jgi:hypothetical protein
VQGTLSFLVTKQQPSGSQLPVRRDISVAFTQRSECSQKEGPAEGRRGLQSLAEKRQSASRGQGIGARKPYRVAVHRRKRANGWWRDLKV